MCKCDATIAWTDKLTPSKPSNSCWDVSIKHGLTKQTYTCYFHLLSLMLYNLDPGGKGWPEAEVSLFH